MKRYLVALASAGLVGGVVLGSAAALNVDGGVVQSGQDTDLTCQDSPVNVVQRSEFDVQEPFSTGPRVTNVDSSCSGENLVVTAFDDAGTQLGQATMENITPVAPDSRVNGNWDTGNIPLADIESLTVTLIS